jgi:MscS family membrane protein
MRCVSRRLLAGAILLWTLALPVTAQTLPGAAPAPAPDAAAPVDPLGRTTPRGTVLGFLASARKGDEALARQYLDTRLPDAAAETLAHQLFAVLDARLPPRLTLLNDTPVGSRANPLAPEEEVVGSVSGPEGPLDIVLERVTRAKAAPLWLFSAATLDAIPQVYDDVRQQRARMVVPRFLFKWRIASVRVFEWLVVLIALTGLYLTTVVLNVALSRIVPPIGRRLFRMPAISDHDVLPMPARILIITILSRWAFENLPVSLLVRQHLANLASLLLIVSIGWLLILVNGGIERRLIARIPRATMGAAVSLLRVGRRVADVLVVFLAVIVTLRRYGVNPAPVLAGLGVGGLAIALAAQKTLENVIAGASLIFDQALRVGDYVRVGTSEGAVEHIGLRSTRIRTPDRSVVSIPNGQIANMSLEVLSERDRFWFHPTIGLRYETTPEQLRAVLEGVRRLLAVEAFVDGTSIRVRFLRMGAFSLDVEVFAYLYARDWAHFLELQEGLLFRVMDVVSTAGTAVAFPSQTMYVVGNPNAESA